MTEKAVQARVRSRFSDVEQFINRYWEKNGRSPGLAEIAEGLSLPISNIHRTVRHMKEEGLLFVEGVREIRTRQQLFPSAAAGAVPLAGSIACGALHDAVQDIEGYYPLPEELFGNTSDCFLLRASGDSMLHAGISSGDLVLVRRQNTAERNQIVAAVYNGEASLKYYRPGPEKGEITLHPANPEYPDICLFPDAGDVFQIQGVVKKIIKNCN